MRLSVAVLAAICVTFALTVPLPPAVAKQAWTAIAGGGTKDFSVVANAFYPRSLEIATGDTVTWQIKWFHNVAFLSGGKMPPAEVEEGGKIYLNPQVAFPAGGREYFGKGYFNSGVPIGRAGEGESGKPFSYTLTFTKPGQYSYVCLIHGPSMGGTVIVKGQSMASPAAVRSAASKQEVVTQRAGQRALANLKVDRMGNNVVVPLIGRVRDGYSLLRFTRRPLEIRTGTTVTWKMADPFEIHTVTFTSGQKPPLFILPQPQAQGPPKLLFNPMAAAPTKTKTYAGKGYVNSGILVPQGAPGPGSYSLTFTKAGRYEYWCIVHVPEGMKGVIVVR